MDHIHNNTLREYHLWYSEQMYQHNKKIYIYKNIKGDKLRGTAVSNTKQAPFHNIERSIFKDFKYIGLVNNYVTTVDHTKDNIKDISTKHQLKNFTYPKPLSY
jgi:hypothetical protein